MDNNNYASDYYGYETWPSNKEELKEYFGISQDTQKITKFYLKKIRKFSPDNEILTSELDNIYLHVFENHLDILNKYLSDYSAYNQEKKNSNLANESLLYVINWANLKGFNC